MSEAGVASHSILLSALSLDLWLTAAGGCGLKVLAFQNKERCYFTPAELVSDPYVSVSVFTHKYVFRKIICMENKCLKQMLSLGVTSLQFHHGDIMKEALLQ